MPFQPTNWRDASITNATRIQAIFAIDPALTPQQKLALYQQAHYLAAAMMNPNEKSSYWGIFVNALRVLVAGTSECDPKELFDQ